MNEQINCKSKCFKYKTEKNFLCDQAFSSPFSNKKWCYITGDQLNNIGFRDDSQKPYLRHNNYWDFINNEDPDTQTGTVCITKDKFDDFAFKKCTDNDKKKYLTYLFAVFMNFCVKPITAIGTPILFFGRKHLYQTAMLANMSDKNFLIFMLNEFDVFLNINFVKKGLLTLEDVNPTINEFKQRLNNIDANDSLAAGEFLKDIFRESLKRMQNPQLGIYSTTVIKFLIDKVPTQYLIQALHGANFVIEDNGELYNYSKNKMLGYGRFSSHAKNATDVIQYGNTDLFADCYLHLLTGSFKYKDGRVVSWFQLEGAPMPEGSTTIEVFKNIITKSNFHGFQEYTDHFVDSVYYFADSMFISKLRGSVASNLALGTSPHTDKNPIFITSQEEINSQKNYTKTDMSYEPLDNQFTRTLSLISNITSHNIGQGVSNSSREFMPSSNVTTYLPETTISTNMNRLISRGGIKRKTRFNKKNQKKHKTNKTKKHKTNKKKY